jgi:hypothetical protein
MRTKRLLQASAALALVLSAGALPTPSTRAAAGRVTIMGTNGALVDGYPYGGPAEAEFWLRCREQVATSSPNSDDPRPTDVAGTSPIPTTNGLGAWVIDLGVPKTGVFSATATVAPTRIGPEVPDPTGGKVFPSGSYQLYNYDLDIHFATSTCGDAGAVQTQNPNETGTPTLPARYMIIVLAFNGTGSPAVSVDYTTP